MTKKFVCKLCGYNTDIKAHLIAHLETINPCKVSQEVSREDLIKELKHIDRKLASVKCEYCDKEVSKSNYGRHKKTCKQKSTAEIQDIKALVKALTSVADSLMQFVSNASSSNVSQVNNYNITQNNIILNNYGQENTSHLTHEFLSQCLVNPNKGITNLIGNIHYNNDIPENHNVRYKSIKHNTFEKYIDSQWTECDATNTLDELIRKGYRILNAHYMEFFMNDPEIQEDHIKQRVYEKFRFLGDKTCNDYHSVKRDLRCLIKDKTMYLLQSP